MIPRKMQTKNQAKSNIVELCTENEYGSWEFWSDKAMTEEEGQNIIDALDELVAEKKIFPVEFKNIKNRSYQVTQLDRSRLETEVKRSMAPHRVYPFNFYWFVATHVGKREDGRVSQKAG
jgi:hypothetical protein